MEKGLVLVVIDGLTPSVFERAVENGDAPALALLAGQGTHDLLHALENRRPPFSPILN